MSLPFHRFKKCAKQNHRQKCISKVSLNNKLPNSSPLNKAVQVGSVNIADQDIQDQFAFNDIHDENCKLFPAFQKYSQKDVRKQQCPTSSLDCDYGVGNSTAGSVSSFLCNTKKTRHQIDGLVTKDKLRDCSSFNLSQVRRSQNSDLIWDSGTNQIVPIYHCDEIQRNCVL